MRSLGWMATVVCMQVSLTHVNKIETRYGVPHSHMKLSEVHDTCLSYLSSSCEHKFQAPTHVKITQQWKSILERST